VGEKNIGRDLQLRAEAVRDVERAQRVLEDRIQVRETRIWLHCDHMRERDDLASDFLM